MGARGEGWNGVFEGLMICAFGNVRRQIHACVSFCR